MKKNLSNTIKIFKMRKISLTLVSLVFVVAVIGILSNCTKQEEIMNTSSLNKQNDDDLINRIHQFLVDAENSRNGIILKTGSKVSLDFAIFYIDATFNYTYCFPTSTYNDTHFDTTYTEFPIDDSLKVLYTDVVTAYNNAVDSVRLKYRSISDTTKKLNGIILEDLGTEMNNYRQIKIISIIGTGSYPSSILDSLGDFGIDDEYWYAEGSYKCDGSGEEGGAPDMLEGEIFLKYKSTPPPGYRVTFTDIDEYPYTAEYIDFEVDQTKDNYCDYRIFYASSIVGTINSETKCLDYNQGNSGIHEMEFYLDGAEHVCDWWLENEVSANKTFQRCFFDHQDINSPFYQIMHLLSFWSGVKHLIKITPENQGYPTPID